MCLDHVNAEGEIVGTGTPVFYDDDLSGVWCIILTQHIICYSPTVDRCKA